MARLRDRKFLAVMMNQAGFRLPYSVDFSTLADGVLPSQFTGSTWAVSSGKAVNTPTLGSELLGNTDFETWTNETTPGSWSAAAITRDAEVYRSANYSGRIDIVSSGGKQFYQNIARTAGIWYRGLIYGRTSVDGKYGKLSNVGCVGMLEFPTNAFAEVLAIGLATSTGNNLFDVDRATAGDYSLYFDDATLKAITGSTLFALLPPSTADIRALSSCTVTSGAQAGIIVKADARTNPQNYLLAYFSRSRDQAKMVLAQFLAGVPTLLLNVNATYVAGADVEVRVTGTTAKLYYNGSQVGADQTINAALTDNKIHGLFSTDGGNSLNTFFLGDPTHVFTRTASNPVVDGVELYEENHVQEPQVLYEAGAQILETADPVFKMWYSSGWGTRTISYAESTDGITWTKYAGNPVANATRKSVMKNGDTYVMYASNASRWVSSNGVDWTLTHSGVIPNGPAGSWDEGGMENTCVWVEDGTWYILYEARGTGSLNRWQIGLATSPDGITWTKYASNPVMPSLVGSTSGPWVRKIGGTYYCFMHGSPVGILPTDIYVSYSTDLINWTRHLGLNFVRLLANEGVGNANGQVADPALAEVGGITYMWYTGMADQVACADINLATAPMPISELVR
jgi:predicted GH43/DUF377 family glycosyl hydrolase